jgi:hypothetical protein
MLGDFNGPSWSSARLKTMSLKSIDASDTGTLRIGISACNVKQLEFDLWAKMHEGR